MRSNRRDFIRRSALLSLSACLGTAGGSPRESSGELHLATNQYPWTVFYDRDGEEFDTGRVLSEVAAAGFNGYEPLVTSVAELKALAPLLLKYRLDMRSLYVNSTLHESELVEKSLEDILEIAGYARRLGVQIIVTNPSPIRWGGSEDKDDQQLRVQAKALNRLGGELSGLGLQLAYHNHDTEFRKGAREFHHMLVGTDAEVVHFCIDAHWIYRACGNSSVALFDVLELYAPRVIELHVRQSEAGIWTEVLEDGDIDYGRLATQLLKRGCKPHLVLEQSTEKNSPHTRTALEAHKETVAYARAVFGILG